MQKVFLYLHLHLHTEFTFPDFYLYRNIFRTFDLTSGWAQCGGVFNIFGTAIINNYYFIYYIEKRCTPRYIDQRYGIWQNRKSCQLLSVLKYYRASTEDYNPRDQRYAKFKNFAAIIFRKMCLTEAFHQTRKRKTEKLKYNDKVPCPKCNNLGVLLR